ncbi:hypothetical protein [Amycolatopsis vancoresmycina]|uniref:hypothetical protein n=1 Tax=Amycolatopsis vancoresmycina TaxID=208444 RepID=UPI0012DEB677|nr:hypothetical protein [Amycolatopsis vancoresmycina]
MTRYLDNPAGRLLALVEQARGKKQDASASQQWAEIFHVDHLGSDFFRSVANFSKMVADVRTQMQEVEPDEYEFYLEYFSQVETMTGNFGRCLVVQMSEFLVPLEPQSGEHSLKLCSAILHRKKSEGELSESERDSLLEKVLDLIDEVERVDDLKGEAREWILLRLREIRRVLEARNQFGVADLSAAHDLLVGGVKNKQARVAALAKSMIAKNFIGLIVALDLAVNLGANSLQITQGDDAPKSTSVVIQIQRDIEQINIESSSVVPQLPAGRENGTERPSK